MEQVKLRSHIKELRPGKDFTREKLARLADVSRRTIGHIERNRYTLSLIPAYKISRAPDSRIEEVFGFRWTERRLNIVQHAFNQFLTSY